MAKVKVPLLAENDTNYLTPEEAMMLQAPTPADPSQADIPLDENAVAPNGVPAPLASMSASQQLLQLINSPEYQAKVKRYEQLGNQAIEDQRKGVEGNEAIVRKMEDQGPQIDWSPLADLVGNKTYQGPGSVQEQAAKLLALKNQVQTQKAGLTKEQLQMIKDQLGGSLSPAAMLKQASTMDYQARYNPGNAMQNLAEFRAAQTARDKVLQRLATNKDLGARLNAYQALDNALTNMAAGKIRTPQQLQDFQDAIIAGLGMARGQSGVNERAERQFNTLDLKGSRLMQFLTSQPQDVMRNKELIGHLQDLARQEQTNVRRQFGNKLNALGAGYGRLLQKYPDIQADINDALGAYAGQFNSPAIPDVTKLKKGQQVHVGPQPKPFAPVPGQKKSSPKSSGIDADLDSMSPEDLQKWLDTHGGQSSSFGAGQENSKTKTA